jgi:hypothetical protein
MAHKNRLPQYYKKTTTNRLNQLTFNQLHRVNELKRCDNITLVVSINNELGFGEEE